MKARVYSVLPTLVAVLLFAFIGVAFGSGYTNVGFPLLATNGTAAAPSYSASASTGTGLYFGTNQALISSNGTSRALFDANGNVILNNSGSALATNATNGWTYIPTSAGPPTGVPASLPTGALPVQIDSTNNDFYFYSGAWKKVSPTAAETWAIVLANGNTTGANNPSISNGQGIVFRGATATADGIAFGTGGTYSATAPLLLGPSDTGSFISAGSAASGTAGRALTLTSGPAAGTNIAGGNGVWLAGLATGTGASGDLNFQSGYKLATGSTVQTAGDRLRIVGKQTALSTTNTTATTFVQLQLPTSNSSGGCMVTYTVEANDGTNWDTVTGYVLVAASNKAGTVTATVGAATEVQNDNSGTVADTFTTTIATTNVNIRITPTWTVIVPTAVQISYTVVAFGNGVTVAPQ